MFKNYNRVFSNLLNDLKKRLTFYKVAPSFPPYFRRRYQPRPDFGMQNVLSAVAGVRTSAIEAAQVKTHLNRSVNYKLFPGKTFEFLLLFLKIQFTLDDFEIRPYIVGAFQ